jgi:uncharacterized membrane protein
MHDLFTHIPDWLRPAIFALNRWLHVVCTALLVGGALFYEFVIPKAIEDLKEETQLAVLGRVRWFFRQVVVFSSLILILSGTVTCLQQWHMYNGIFHEARTWLYLHVAVGLLAILIANLAVSKRRSPREPLRLLRVNFVVLLVVIFIASVSRQVWMMVIDNVSR